MTSQSLLLLVLFLSLLLLLAYPLGIYLAKVGMEMPLSGLGWLGKLEKALYRFGGVSANDRMTWKGYALALLTFNAIGTLFVYAIQRIQYWLPLNPQHFANVRPDSAFNTAISFSTNTNWQSYSGETTMSYLTQMLALTGQNFFSAATGIAVLFALIRGFASDSCKSIGNFWVDLTRITIYVLMPLATVFAIFLMSQGVIQNFSAYKKINVIDPVNYIVQEGKVPAEKRVSTHQTLAMGPVASQESIKILGSNGGGFFNANSAHPYENPTPLSNFFQMILIFLIPLALCFTFGIMISDMRQAWAILTAMALIFVLLAAVVLVAEQRIEPELTALGIDQRPGLLQAGGNMEGKETRFGISASSLFAAATTSSSCGAVNSMHDSYTPIGGMVLLVLMQLGEVAFGGVGSGLYSMLIFAVVAVFIAGLMIGRTPEYLGKKIQSYEIKMASMAILITPILVLAGTAIAVMFKAGKTGIANPGPHGFSEILYAFSSVGNSNGSAFAGLSANTPFYNSILALVMWFGRFATMIPILAVAGSLASKKRLAATSGTMPTHGPLFIALIIGTVILIGVLNYVPALALGPLVEQLTP